MRQKLPLSSPFNGTACFIPFPFISHSLSIHDPFVFLSISVQSPCAFSVHFKSVLYSFYVCNQLLHMAIYDCYSLLKSAHAGQQFACSRKKDSDSLTAPIWIVLASASHASLNHTLCLCDFLLLFFCGRNPRSSPRRCILLLLFFMLFSTPSGSFPLCITLVGIQASMHGQCIMNTITPIICLRYV